MAEANGFGHPAFVKIKRGAELDLERMAAGFGLSVEMGGVSPGIRRVAGDGKAQLGQGPLRIDNQLRRGSFTVTVPYDDVGAARGGRHGVAINDNGDPKQGAGFGDQLGQGGMVGPVETLEAESGLVRRQAGGVNLDAVAYDAWDDAEARWHAGCAWPDRRCERRVEHVWVEFAPGHNDLDK